MRMKSNIAVQPTLQRRDRTPAITKVALAIVLLLGIAVIFAGWFGMREYSTSNFSSEAGYQAIYKLSGDVDEAWKRNLQPQLDSLDSASRAVVDAAAYQMVASVWESQKEGGQAELDAALGQDSGRTERLYKLLYTTYLVNGPKVAASARKEIAAVDAKEQSAFRTALLTCIADENAVVPAAAEKGRKCKNVKYFFAAHPFGKVFVQS